MSPLDTAFVALILVGVPAFYGAAVLVAAAAPFWKRRTR